MISDRFCLEELSKVQNYSQEKIFGDGNISSITKENQTIAVHLFSAVNETIIII